MKLVATIPLRNEDWIAGLSLRVALEWCDEIVCLNHASVDHTVDILADVSREYPGRVHVLSCPDSQWTEMQHRQMMLEYARTRGASHIAIVDADEILTGNLVEFARTGIATAAARGIVDLPGYNLRGGITRYHANGTWGRRHFAVAFKDEPRLYWFDQIHKAEQFHHREPFGANARIPSPIPQGQGGIMHLWGASERRLRAKHALYKVTERLRWPEKQIPHIDAMYSWWKTGQRGEEPQSWKFADVPDSWWAPYQRWMQYLHLHGQPRQEGIVCELVAKHGRETFSGLDLFGIA